MAAVTHLLPDWPWLAALIPVSIYSAGEPGFVPLTVAVAIAWFVLLVRSWRRGESREIVLPAIGLVVLVAARSMDPSIAFTLSESAMSAEAEAVLSEAAPREQGAQFIGLVPVWSIRPTSCDDGAVFFVTGALGFWKSGYAYSTTPLPEDQHTCHYTHLRDNWYRARLNYN
ncbi:MAG: hypothetical protein R2707_12760 [Acidimicrobiales bacterium]